LTLAATLGIGTAAFIPGYGLRASSDDCMDIALVERAVEAGIDYIDTAAAYADGEQRLGTISPLLGRRRVRVCTKVQAGPASSTADIVERARESVARLRTPAVDTILLHSASESALDDETLAGAMQEIKRQRLATHTGASTYGLACVRALKQPWCDVVQLELSILNTSAVAAARAAKAPGQAIVARSVLCKGLLTERRRNAGESVVPIVERVDALDRLAREWSFSLPELAIRFALDEPQVDVVLVGVSSTGELDTALSAARRRPLSDDQRGALAAFESSELACVHPEQWA
jgi:aryl-alcohol dehydrogenase-like predicted oxidoreductase